MPKGKKGGRKQSSGDYEVGYRKPPERSRFKKGVSGNPRGRPKQLDGVPDIIEKLARHKIPVNWGGKVLNLQIIEAMMRKVALRALTGDVKAVKYFVELTEKTNAFERPLEIRVKYIDPAPPQPDDDDPAGSASSSSTK